MNNPVRSYEGKRDFNCPLLSTEMNHTQFKSMGEGSDNWEGGVTTSSLW